MDKISIGEEYRRKRKEGTQENPKEIKCQTKRD